MIWRAGAIWLALAGSVGAVDLSLPPSARLMADRNTAPDSYAAPVSVFETGGIQTVTVEGDIARSAWRIGSAGMTSLQVLRPLRAQLETAGYDTILDCSADMCGGFDFRFATEVLPGPNMYVNIRDYQFITAIEGPVEKPTSVVTILASAATTAAYVQIIQAGAESAATAAQTSPDAGVPAVDVGAGGIVSTLLKDGHVVLRGLDFDTGTSGLGQEGLAALQELATFLGEQPQMRIALVGHTDTVGGLQGNIALSRERAQAVRQRLIDDYDIAPERVEAEGTGYLAPLATNRTAEGREANRRVEAVLLPVPDDD